MHAFQRSFVAVVTFAIAAAVCAQPAPERVSGWTDRKPVGARTFMIAAANPLAVDAGHAVLARGGSAVDAAIAAQLVLGLVEPQSSGIGGGGFMLVHDAAANKLVAYDGRETAPAAAKPERFLGSDGKPLRFLEAVIGGRSVGVPGTVALLAATHKAHGRLKWSELFQPAITLAEQGFVVSPRLASAIATTEGPMGNDHARQYFARADGQPLRAGDTLRNPAYARTLRMLATQGPDAFYRGDIARDVVATANGAASNPGDLTLDDLANYRVKVRTPVCGAYRSYRVCGMPLPSSGGSTVLQMLAMLEPYDLEAMGPASFWSAHFIAEAGRLAYADRGAFMADPDFVAPPAGLLDRELPARTRRADSRNGDARSSDRGDTARDCTCAGARRRPARRDGAALDIAPVDRRRARQRGVDDDDDRERLRKPADDAGRVPAQQRAHRFQLRCRRRTASRSPIASRPASARARRWRRRSSTTAAIACS